jgi:hypothetical protein
MKDSNANPKVKTTKEEKNRARYFVCSTFRIKGVCWSSGMGIKTSDKHVDYSYQFTQTKQQVG